MRIPYVEHGDDFCDVRTGEPPIFGNMRNPKLYRRELIEWVKFQDMTVKDSSKYLTLEQHVIAITSKIFGSTKLRMANVMYMMHSRMTEEEYADIIDYIFQTIDLVDKESLF